MPLAVEISQALGVLIVILGAWGFIAPARVMALTDRFANRKGQWFAALIRLVLGAALWFAASQSRAPLLLEVLAVITIIAAVVIPLLGIDRFKAMLGWFKKLPHAAVRGWCVLAVAFGVVILWALVPTAT